MNTAMTTTPHRTADIRRDTKETQIRVAIDLDGSGAVGSPDLAILLGAWGACP